MSELIVSKDLLLAQKPAVIQVDLPDMGKTVCVLKGTWKTLQEIQGMGEGAANMAQQVALILCSPDGERLITSPEDVEKLGAILSLQDMVQIMQQWQAANGIGEDAQENLLKNSDPSQLAASA